LQDVPQLDSFDLKTIPEFTTVGMDKTLLSISKQRNALFASSTSSISGILAQIYTLITNRKSIDTSSFTADVKDNVSRRFSPFVIGGTKIQLLYRDGVYAIETVNSKDSTTVLMTLVKYRY
jgi:hypothetical protein